MVVVQFNRTSKSSRPEYRPYPNRLQQQNNSRDSTISKRLRNSELPRRYASRNVHLENNNSKLIMAASNLAELLTLFFTNVTGPHDSKSPITYIHEDSRRPKSTYNVECYTCMSSYFEREWHFLRHMYNTPMVFSDSCNFGNLDTKKLRVKNCTDMCVWLRVEDRIAGIKRPGYMRGCMSDILNYNRTTTRFLTYRDTCTTVRLANLFNRGHNYGFENNEEAFICACHKKQCNNISALSANWCFIVGILCILFIFRKQMSENSKQR